MADLKGKTIMFVNLCKNVVAFMGTYGRKNIIMNKCLTYPNLCSKKKDMNLFADWENFFHMIIQLIRDS